jgi:predicted nucleic acid-binding protein
VYFLESSALVKLFVRERGTDAMIRLVESSEDATKHASSLASVEVRSALRRRQRNGDVSTADAAAALDLLDSEWRRLIDNPITGTVIAHTSPLIDRHYLRALDAIQLATAVAARDTLRNIAELTFVCTDERLIRAAQAEGFRVLNPELM